MVSQILYGKRFGPYFVEPVVAGLDSNNQPYINVMDLIGAPVLTDDFVVAGTSSQNLYGMAEALYRKDLNPDELFETISQALLASIDRDALAGWGAIVHIITPEGVSIRELKARQD
jgi:20S proteasome subunit beta 3